MTDQEILCTMALMRVPSIGLGTARRLFLSAGSATEIFTHHKDIKSICPEANEKLQEALVSYPTAVEGMKKELDFIHKHQIQCLGFNEEDYPCRMRECDDAPLLLFFKGSVDINQRHIINMVGTRHCTEYGKDLCKDFLTELAQLVPDTLVVSGLAYGIDVNAHAQALANGLNTIGVLAHGLDRLYPSSHRRLAHEMVSRGGLLTEFPSGTNPDPFNFVQRNRIVAGIADACIVVESSAKGGSLITADIAEGYHRDVFAFPGRVSDCFSVGCNNLIRDNKAILLQGAADFVKAMGWEAAPLVKQPIQRELFTDLSPEESLITQTLQGNDGKHINGIVVESGLPISRVSALLFALEMRGIVKALTGGVYRLL